MSSITSEQQPVPYPTPPREKDDRHSIAAMEHHDLVNGLLQRVGAMNSDSDGSTTPSSPRIAVPDEPYTPPETPQLKYEPRQQEDANLLGVGPGSKWSPPSTKRNGIPIPVRTGWTPPLQSAERFVAETSVFDDGGVDAATGMERRRSIYLPLDESRVGTPSDTWTFRDGQPFHDPELPPKSPSHIHPSYGLPPIPDLLEDRRSQLPATYGEIGSDTKNSPPPPRPFYTHPEPSLTSRRLSSTSLRSRPSPATKSWLDSPASWLILYFFANLALTLYNKVVLVKFPFPWTLTGIHTLCGAIGAQTALNRGLFTQARLTRREASVLVAFSGLYTINIAVSNLSLNLVTVPFHQVVRAMTPLFTIAISVTFLRKSSSQNTYLSLVPIILGVAFATYGDYYFTMWGLVLTLFGTLLAAMKTVLTNTIQVGRLKLHPLDLLLRMSPLAFVQCVLCGWYTGELDRVRAYGAMEMTRGRALALLVNGFLAFLLNVVSFSANKKTSPLTMTVAANVKQVLTILLAVLVFNLKVTAMNLLGICLTLGGGMVYAAVELREKRERGKRQPVSPLSGVHVPLTAPTSPPPAPR